MKITNLICSLAILGALAAFPPSARANHSLPSEVVISVRFGPPVLPVYAQPLCPGPGYIWVPGYWAYDEDEGYYWVPGTWVLAPEVGLLWTPGYWAYRDDRYYWNGGYWGPEVGFYGGINYGYGYPGRGFYGGYWRDREFYYNRNANNINTTVIHNVYNATIVNNHITNSRASFNGGPGGVNVQPTPQETAAAHQRHVAMTTQQTQHIQAARSDRSLMASVNHGRPDVAATPRPGAFHGAGVAAATSAAGAAAYHGGGRAPANNHAGAAPENGNANPRNPSANAPARSAPDRPAPERRNHAPAHQPSRAPGTERAPNHNAVPKSAPAPRPAPSRPAEKPAPSRPAEKAAPSRPPERSAPPHQESRPAPSHPAPSHPQERSAPAASHAPAARTERSAPAPRQSAPREAPKPSQPNDNKKPEHPGS